MEDEIIKERRQIKLDRNNSLMSYLQYRVLFNQGKRTFKGDVKVFFMDIKIKVWAYLSQSEVVYSKEDDYTQSQKLKVEEDAKKRDIVRIKNED